MEVEDLQDRVSQDEEKEEEARRESFGLKQKIVATEASKEQALKENSLLSRKLSELEGELRAKRQKTDIRGLEGKIDSLDEELAENKMKLSASEGRVNGLENEMVKTEAMKRDVEFKLGSLHSALRRTLGISRLGRTMSPMRGMRSASPSPQRRCGSPSKNFDNTFTTTTDGKGDPIPTTGSPERNPDFTRSASPSRSEQLVQDIDPEVVRAALRDFLQELKDTQRDKDDAKIEISNLTRQLMEMEGDRDRVNQRLQHLQKSLGEAEEGKRGAHGRLSSAQTALMLQEETIRRNEREQKQTAEKLAGLERTCQST